MVTVNARYALGKLHNGTRSYRKTRRVRRCVGSARRSGARPAHGHQMHELGSIDVMRLDQTLGQSRHVACASGCISMRTSLEEGIKLHRFAGPSSLCPKTVEPTPADAKAADAKEARVGEMPAASASAGAT